MMLPRCTLDMLPSSQVPDACDKEPIGCHLPHHAHHDAAEKQVEGVAYGVDPGQEVAPPTQLVRGEPCREGNSRQAEQEGWGSGGGGGWRGSSHAILEGG